MAEPEAITIFDFSSGLDSMCGGKFPYRKEVIILMANVTKIQRKNGGISYRIAVSNGFNPDGSPHYDYKTLKDVNLKAKTPTARMKEAQRIADEWEEERKGLSEFKTDERADKIRVQEIIPDWLEWLNSRYEAGEIKESVIHIYNRDYEKYCKEEFDNRTVASVTSRKVQDFVNGLRREKKYSANTAKKSIDALQSIWTYIVTERHLTAVNPCAGVKVVKEKHTGDKQENVFTPEQAELFLSVLNTKREVQVHERERENKKGEKYPVKPYKVTMEVALYWKAFFQLMVTTGSRVGEMRALMWKDVDFDNGQLHICRAVEETMNGLKISDTKTAESVRTVSVPTFVLKTMSDWKDEQMETAKTSPRWAGKPVKEFREQLVFPGRYGGVILGIDVPNHQLKKTIRKWNAFIDTQAENAEEDEIDGLLDLKLPEITAYGLRHTNVTYEVESNTPLNIVASRVGHSQVSTTTGYYTHGDKKAASTRPSAFENANILVGYESDMNQTDLLELNATRRRIVNTVFELPKDALEQLDEFIVQLQNPVQIRQEVAV